MKERLFGLGLSNQEVVSANYRLVHESKLTRQVEAEFNFGKAELTYSNNSLATISDVLIAFKSMPAFRDLTIIPSCMIPRTEQSKQYQSMSPDLVREEREQLKERQKMLGTLSDFHSDKLRQSHPDRLQAKTKAKVVSTFFQKCQVDLKVQGDRLYISCFDDKTRDQVAKFITPPVSMSLLLHPRDSPQEC